MAKIIYQTTAGEQYEIEVANGKTVMEGAIYNGIPGILAECGGSCACATCHVYVEERFMDKVGELGEYEGEMLEETASPSKDNSRLSCQIRVTDELDGLIVHLPEKQ
jgi:2Fe-2S ferredoxin